MHTPIASRMRKREQSYRERMLAHLASVCRVHRKSTRNGEEDLIVSSLLSNLASGTSQWLNHKLNNYYYVSVDEGPAIAVGLVCGRTRDADAAKEPADIQLGYLAVHQRITHQLFLLGRHGEFLI